LNLVCISGGSNSMALLDLLHYSLFRNQSSRKLFFRVHILFIEEGSAVYGHNDEQRTKSLAFVKEVCDRYSFTYTIVPLESVFDIDLAANAALDMRIADPETVQQIEEEKKQDELVHAVQSADLSSMVEVADIEAKRQRIRELFKCLPTTSNFREDLVLYFKRWIIVNFALRYNFKKILFGATGHKVATNLLA